MATTQAMEEQQAKNEAAYAAANGSTTKSSGTYTKELASKATAVTNPKAGATVATGAALGAGTVIGSATAASVLAGGATTAAAASAGLSAGITLGATAGSVVPIVGTAIGAVAGAVISAVGYGHYKAAKAKKKQARAYYKAAQATLQEREQNAQYDNYLQMIREARITRAGSLAGITSANLMTSSLGTSALSSIGSQSQYSLQYTANDQRLIAQYEEYMTKAKAAAAKYQSNLSKANAITTTAFQVGGAAIGGAAGGFSGAATGAQFGGQIGSSVTNLTNTFI